MRRKQPLAVRELLDLIVEVLVEQVFAAYVAR